MELHRHGLLGCYLAPFGVVGPRGVIGFGNGRVAEAQLSVRYPVDTVSGAS